MSVLEKIEQLKNEGLLPKEVENLLLKGKLGEIITRSDGYQYIGSFLLNHLVVEAHEPGFVEWMWAHPNEYVVHHIDGNPLNNIYTNLQIMSRSDHASIHRNEYYADPMNAEDVKARGKKHSDWFKDPANKEDVEAMHKAVSAYYADPANTEDVEARSKAISKTQRKNNGWITPDSNPEVFENPFFVKEYVEVSKVDVGTAYYRLASLVQSGEITCEKKLIDGSWRSVYRKK